MPDPYYRAALTRYRASRAERLGCAVDDFASHALAIVPRPEGAYTNLTLIGVTFGTGTVVSVAPAYLDWVRANAPADKHYRALFPNVLLAPLAAEAERRGEPLHWRAPGLIFLPAREPEAAAPPAGLTVARIDLGWRERWFPTGIFHNSLGDLEDPADQHFRWGVAIMDGATPAAVAGAWDDGEGLLEIGVDVAREYRGRGLGEVVVTNLARSIADEDAFPTYYCAATNVRSHRTALASGFVPVASSVQASPQRPAPA